MQRDPVSIAKARKAERKADEKAGLISFKPVKIDGGGVGGSGGGFKKGGFKSAFKVVGEVKKEEVENEVGLKNAEMAEETPGRAEESDTADEDYEVYDPRKPTD